MAFFKITEIKRKLSKLSLLQIFIITIKRVEIYPSLVLRKEHIQPFAGVSQYRNF